MVSLTPSRGVVVSTILGLSTLFLGSACLQDTDAVEGISTPITLPSQFTDSPVANVGSPTAFAFTPDNRLLITSQKGPIRVVKNGSLLGTPAIDLTSKICSNSERGVLGIAVDPDFASTKHVFVYYTAKKGSPCVNRVSRFTLNGDTMGSEQVLLDDIPSTAGNHNGGDVQFGGDGHLYVSVGDGGCQWPNGGNCGGGNQTAKHKSIILGKILRIRKDGSIPSDNPWVNDPGARRCAEPGNPQTPELNNSKPCVETWQWGLRNPFRIAFNPAGNKLYINDVGQNVSEEIDHGSKGANFGWPSREGYCANGQSCNPGSPPAGMTNPIFAWERDGGGITNGCKSITGGAFVPQGTFGSSFDGSYLFADYVCGKIFQLQANNTVKGFATSMGGSSATHLKFGPNPSGGGQSLYYATYAGGGQVRRISFTGTTNRPPVAQLVADPTDGSRPLQVNFDGGDSSDPDQGDAVVTYLWDFGNGQTRTTSTPTTSFTYTSDGVFNVKLKVKDESGLESENTATAKITVGNTAPTVTINSPEASKLFATGEMITLSASADDAEDSSFPASAFTWNVIRIHNDHTHPYFTGTGATVAMEGAAPEDLEAAGNSYLQLQVTVKDSGGLTHTATQNLNPKKVQLTFASSPSGLTLTLDNTTTVTTPRTVTSWQGWFLRVNAPAQGQFEFSSWSDGGAQDHTIKTPGSPTTYTATFSPTAPGGFEAKISFRPASSAAPEGYLADNGAAYGARGSFKYGWNGDNSANTRDRNSPLSPDERHDGLNHMQKPSLPAAVWEIEVPNGSYTVKVVQGDAAHSDSFYNLKAENTILTSSAPTASNLWVTGTATVNVSDGKLTLSNGPSAANNKLCFVDIKKL